jgi:cytosine/adenosine deaminase-related metal-dependent hydrolase
MSDLLIKHATILTMDKKRQIIQDGAIAVKDDLIIDVGVTKKLTQKHRADMVIDAENNVAIPGLINTHMHIGYTLLKGIATDISDRLTWLSSVYPYVIEAKYDDCYHAALLGCLEMIKGGTTYFVENNPFISDPLNLDAMAKDVEETGIRAALGRVFSDINAPEFLLTSHDYFTNEFKRLFDTWHNKADGRIRIWVYAPGPGIRESEKRMKEVLDVTEQYKTMVSSHWAEGGEGRNYYLDHYNVSPPTKFLLDNSYLRPETLLVHVVTIDEQEIQMLADTGTMVAHCPTTNLARAGHSLEISPVRNMLDAGVTVGLGTDASICNDKSSMFETMKQAVLLQKLKVGDPRGLTAEKALEMATINGAKVVGLEDQIGSLEAGKKADIVLIDVWKPHILPIHNIVENIVYCANETDVDTVIINGKIVMAKGKMKTVDESAVLEKAVSVTKNLDVKAKEKAKDISSMWEESYKKRYGKKKK